MIYSFRDKRFEQFFKLCRFDEQLANLAWNIHLCLAANKAAMSDHGNRSD
jgi:hypothetical protein